MVKTSFFALVILAILSGCSPSESYRPESKSEPSQQVKDIANAYGKSTQEVEAGAAAAAQRTGGKASKQDILDGLSEVSR